MIAPVLLMTGLAHTSAASASLLLNFEVVFSVLLAWFVFKENFDSRIAAGMALIAAGGVLLSWSGEAGWIGSLGSLAIVGACLGWAVDNNLTRRISLCDPVQIAGLKGLFAGLEIKGVVISPDNNDNEPVYGMKADGVLSPARQWQRNRLLPEARKSPTG